MDEIVETVSRDNCILSCRRFPYVLKTNVSTSRREGCPSLSPHLHIHLFPHLHTPHKKGMSNTRPKKKQQKTIQCYVQVRIRRWFFILLFNKLCNNSNVNFPINCTKLLAQLKSSELQCQEVSNNRDNTDTNNNNTGTQQQHWHTTTTLAHNNNTNPTIVLKDKYYYYY